MCGGIQTPLDQIRRNIPEWVTLNSLHTQTDVRTPNGSESAEITLKNGSLEISGTDFRYTPDEGIIVCDCFLYDLDRDGCDEVLLHTWRRGSFAKYEPFWREKDNKSVYTEHLFVYEWDESKENRLKPVWMSSQMPVTGKKVWTEPDSTVHILSVNGKESVWRWEKWGLVRQDNQQE